MTTYSRSERIIRFIEWSIPTRDRWGACHTDVLQALAEARIEIFNRTDGAIATDDQIRVFPGDDEIIIRIEVDGDGAAASR